MRIRVWVGILLFSVTLLIMAGSALLYWDLESEISERLRTRQFLAPTTFWSAPEPINLNETWQGSEIEKIFERWAYRNASNPSSLSPGEWTKRPCQNTPDDQTESSTCYIFRIHETDLPELSKVGLQAIAINQDASVHKLWQQPRSNPIWQEAISVKLEPLRVAQYVGTEPVLQEWTALGEIPVDCLHSTLAIEDPRFLEHSGVNWRGLTRALIVNLAEGRFAQGGSTITQQMVKNFFLNSEKTISRKLKELAMSFVLESKLNKDQILEIYMNIIYLGQSGPFRVHGFTAAAQHYFQKRVQDLKLGECALISAVLNSPGNLDPFRHAERATKRRNLVLEKMRALDHISENEFNLASLSPLPKPRSMKIDETSPYFLEGVQRELKSQNLKPEGLQVFTSLRMEHQESSQRMLAAHLAKLEESFPKITKLKKTGKSLEGVVLSIEVETGQITSFIAGRGFRASPFNRILDAARQVGSLAKPFVFLTAYENDKTLQTSSLLKDEKQTYKWSNQSWTPENYTKKFAGEVTHQFALKNSLNAATAALGMTLQLPDLITILQKSGVRSKMPEVPSLILGAMDLKPIEIAEAYLTLARMGSHISPRMYTSVVSGEGQVLISPQAELSQEFDAGSAAMVIGMLKGTNLTGTAQAVAKSDLKMISAGKTGTTSDYHDAWYIGFTPRDLILVWIGYDQNDNHGLTGASGALPLWISLAKKISEHKVVQDFNWPSSVKSENLTVAPELEPSEYIIRTQ